jgi:Family of unknown function (DUF6290)
MRDARLIGVRLNEHEAKAVETLAQDKDISVSELVRSLIQREAEQQYKHEGTERPHASAH